MRKLVKKFMALCVATSGVTLVEYGLAIAMAVGVGTAGFALLGGAISTEVNAASDLMTN